MSLTTPDKIRTLQRKLYGKAKAEPAFRFYILYDKICREDILEHAYRLARENAGSSGVDGETFERIEASGVRTWLAALREDLVSKRYRPMPVRRVMIPKPGGGQRPPSPSQDGVASLAYGIPTIRDRVAQTAAKLVLEPIFEADFEDNAWGYRPRRSAVDAVKDVVRHLSRGYTDVVDADLSKYFDTIPHDALMSCLARRIVDRHVLHLVKMWLKTPVEERDADGTRRMSGGKKQTRGTPPKPSRDGVASLAFGGVASPLLANLYMNRFLKHWRQKERGRAFRAHVVNYADDFVILSRGRAAEALAWTRQVMTRIGLTINETKTSLKDARTERFDFLGYTFGPHHATGDGHVYLGASPSKKSVQRLKTKVGDMLVPGEKRAWPEVGKRLNRMLNGWAAYFCHGALRSAYTAIDRHVAESVRMFLTKRTKSRGRGTRRFSQDKVFGELGVRRLMRWGSGSPSTASP